MWMLRCAFSLRGRPGAGPPTIQTLPTTLPVAGPPDEAFPPLGALTAPPPPKLHPASTPASTTPIATLRHIPLGRYTPRNSSTSLPGIGADLRVLLGGSVRTLCGSRARQPGHCPQVAYPSLCESTPATRQHRCPHTLACRPSVHLDHKVALRMRPLEAGPTMPHSVVRQEVIKRPTRAHRIGHRPTRRTTTESLRSHDLHRPTRLQRPNRHGRVISDQQTEGRTLSLSLQQPIRP